MRVPATEPYFSDTDIDYISSNFRNILKGDSYLSMYKYGEEFEEKFSERIGTKYAVACNSGTSALELIFRSIGVEGLEVLVPSNTFLATVIAVKNAGGIPVFVDCDDDMCIDFLDVQRKVTKNTAAVTIVHIGGLLSKNIFKLKDFCSERSLYLVEDAAQAHGTSLGGVSAGNFGIAAGFSFFSTKVMTTGEGGMVTTNNQELADKMKSMREFGKVKKGILTNFHQYFGYNWRMPEVSALMGLRQLKSLDKFMIRRREISKIYTKYLYNQKNIDIIDPPDFNTHNFFKYIIILKDHNREKVHNNMQLADISPSGYVYEMPLHKQPVLSEYNHISLPKTEKLCANHFCLPIFYGMKDEQVKYVCEVLIDILSR